MDAGINTGTSDELTRVFVSYAREDAKWLDREYRFNLVPFLMDSLKRQNVVFWFDRDLKPGDEFRRHIEAEIDQSQIALLIVSQAFLNSDFIEKHEMARIAERARLGQTIIVPLLVEPCDWSEYPVLADRQMVPGSVPLIDYTESDSKWARVKAEILDGFKTQVKRIRASQTLARSQHEQVAPAPESAHREADEHKESDAPAPQKPEQEELVIGPGAEADTADRKPTGEETAARPEPDDGKQKRGPKRFPAWAWGVLAVLALLAVYPRPIWILGRQFVRQFVTDRFFAKPAPQPSSQDILIAKADKLYDQKRYAEAAPLYEQLCTGGYLFRCFEVGFMYDTGQGVAKDASRAVVFYSKACDGDSGLTPEQDLACSNLGLEYEHGTGVAQDFSKAVALFSKACDSGYCPYGCTNLGRSYEYGEGVAKDASQAAALYSKACKDGDDDGCKRQAALEEKGKRATPAANSK
jgi:TPR repeat protein